MHEHKPWHDIPEEYLDDGDIVDAIESEDVVRMWARALRDGRYGRCIGRMRVTDQDGDQFDALGLLCKVCVDNGLDHLTNEEWEREHPPYRTARLAGLRCQRAADGMAEGGEVEIIAWMSDRGDRFEDIASVLEMELEERAKVLR